jgi:hypothetical protein
MAEIATGVRFRKGVILSTAPRGPATSRAGQSFTRRYAALRFLVGAPPLARPAIQKFALRAIPFVGSGRYVHYRLLFRSRRRARLG